jgi:hypothetical protein
MSLRHRTIVIAAALAAVLLGTATAASATSTYTSYRLSTYAAGWCLAPIPGGDVTPGTHLTQYLCDDDAREQWTIADVATGGGPVRNLATNLCMGIEGGSHAAGAAVALQYCSGAATQQWDVYHLTVAQTGSADRAGMIAVNKASLLCLDILNHPAKPGGTAVRDTCTWDYVNQFWRAEPTTHRAPPPQIPCNPVLCPQP